MMSSVTSNTKSLTYFLCCVRNITLIKFIFLIPLDKIEKNDSFRFFNFDVMTSHLTSLINKFVKFSFWIYFTYGNG